MGTVFFNIKNNGIFASNLIRNKQRGHKVPSFYSKKMRGKVTKLLEKALEENPSLFLIDLSISEGNKIRVILDGDAGVTVENCMAISRAIEHNLDREEEDFSLEVMSAGVSEPLKITRQYKKSYSFAFSWAWESRCFR